MKPGRRRPLLAGLVAREDGTIELRSPGVGLWREPPADGDTIRGGDALGRLETLHRLETIVAPTGARGRVIAIADPERARAPVGYGDWLVRLDPTAAAESDAETVRATTTADGALVFRSPSSGRFYARPAPDKPVFVSAGQTIERGQVVAILEVMKTFNRVTFDGDDVPDRARVRAVVPADGDDLARGSVLLELEADG